MSCEFLYNVKKVAYIPVTYSEANFKAALETSGYKEILINSDGLSIETKGVQAEYTLLNGVKRTDSLRETLKKTGVLKFSKNFDSAIVTNHPDLITGALGKVNTNVLTTTVTAGKGSVATPFLTISTTNLSVGQLIMIDDSDDNKFFVVESIVSNTSFTVETPLTTTIATSTTFKNVANIDITDAKGTCEKLFNFVVSTADGAYIELLGCGVTAEFSPVFDKQLTISFTVNAAEVVEVGTIPTGFATSTRETKGTVLFANFTKVGIRDDLTETTTISPANFELGLSITSEPIPSITGRNNIIGYTNLTSVKPKISMYRTLDAKTLVSTPRTPKQYYFYQASFSILMIGAMLTMIDRNVVNGSNANLVCEMDVNYSVGSRVYIILP